MAIGRIQRYCAYQERCHSEVRSKLLEIGMRGNELEEVISMLIQDGFLNEERFARVYARSKFRQVQWGRVKIEQALKQKRVSDYCIRKGMEEIDNGEYHALLQTTVEKKWATLKGTAYVKRNKTAEYLIRRGFESVLVWDTLKGMG